MQGMGEKVNIGLGPRHKLPVHPDFIDRFEHGTPTLLSRHNVRSETILNYNVGLRVRQATDRRTGKVR
jgi:hypothetical protein